MLWPINSLLNSKTMAILYCQATILDGSVIQKILPKISAQAPMLACKMA